MVASTGSSEKASALHRIGAARVMYRTEKFLVAYKKHATLHRNIVRLIVLLFMVAAG